MNKRLFGTVLGLIVVIAVLWSGYSSWQSRQPNTSGPRQAIFLGDGQTYFGYASSLQNQIVTLVDVYYLLPASSTDKTPIPTTAQKIDLIKLGLGGENDLVGATDRMEINRDAIKYIEVMKDDSQVNQKIKEYLNKK
ncbi:MAG: hypothetical protein AAB669_00855 [Patescibacteria group bacterium]